MSKPVDVALIGLGGFGASHRKALAALESDGTARLAAAVEVDQVRNAEVVASLRGNGIPVYSDWQELLSAGGFDVVAVAAPLHLHRIMVTTALRRGYPVFCEKSASVTVQDVAAMASAAAETGLLCGIDFQWLSSPAISEMKRLVVSGALGEIRRVVGIGMWKRPDSYYERTGWAGKFRIGSSYVFDGPMYNALAHMLNNCLYCASPVPGELAAPRRVKGEMYRAIPLPEMEDTATVQVETESGAEVLYFATYCSPVQMPHFYRLEGTEGTAILDQRRLILLRGREEQVLVEKSDEGAVDRMYRNFLAALAGKEQLLSPVAESLKLVRAQNGAYMSSGRIHPVEAPHARRYADKDTTATEILGLPDYCHRAAQTGTLLAGAGAPFATATPWVDVTGLESYEPQSPQSL